MPYTVLLNPNGGYPEGWQKITDEGAHIIWDAYKKVNPYGHQTIDRREERGGFMYTSEIEDFILNGQLPSDFDWKAYIFKED